MIINNKEILASSFINEYDDYSYNRLFAHIFDELPNRLKIRDGMDICKDFNDFINYDFLNESPSHYFSSINIQNKAFDDEIYIVDTTVKNLENISEDTKISLGGIYIYPKSKVILVVSSWSIEMYHLFNNDEINVYIESLMKFKEIKGINEFSLLIKDGNSLGLKSFKVKTCEANIDTHYNDDFKEEDNKIQAFVNNDDSGLVILYGLHGTGKSTYIRHLISKINNKPIIYIPADLVSMFSDPSIIPFLSDKRGSLFIIEDCEELLKQRGTNDNINGGIVNLLNMSDGLLSDAFNFKFICTFNTGIENIDKALLRKGRLVSKYDFKELAKEKVKNLIELEGIDIPENDIKDMSLADIYNYSDKSYEYNKTSIGF